jgi:hypothetical protein
MMACFVAIAGKYHRNVRKRGIMTWKLERPLITLYASCVLITIRTIYRTVEVSGVGLAWHGRDAYYPAHPSM